MTECDILQKKVFITHQMKQKCYVFISFYDVLLQQIVCPFMFIMTLPFSRKISSGLTIRGQSFFL